jgi:LysR family nitrogen assimilation transcriptional regulator
VEDAAFRRGVALDRVQQVEGVALTKEMVRGGAGQTVLPHIAVREEVERGTLVFRPIEHDPLLAVHAIASLGGAAPAPFITEISGLLLAVMADLARSGAWTGATAAGVPDRTAGAAAALRP